MSKRRLKWFRDILKYTEDNKQLRAAVFGRLQLEEDEGATVLVIGPWICQLIEDLQIVMGAEHKWEDADGEEDKDMIHFNIKEMVEGSSVGNLLREEYMEWFLEADINTMDSFEECTGRKVGKKRKKGNA